jgi:hypothetical protein
MPNTTKGTGDTKDDLKTDVPIGGYATSRDLAAAIFEKCDVAKIAVLLLTGNASKCNSVRARVWEKLVELYYGKPGSSAGKEDDTEFQVVWDIPGLPKTEPQ